MSHETIGRGVLGLMIAGGTSLLNCPMSCTAPWTGWAFPLAERNLTPMFCIDERLPDGLLLHVGSGCKAKWKTES